jgi:uncharacterized protein
VISTGCKSDDHRVETVAEFVVRSPVAADRPAMLDLNAANETELSPLDQAELQQLLDQALYAGVVGPVGRPQGLVIVLDHLADYQSPNFLWFRDRHQQFAYVDRVVLAPPARGAGHAQRLYLAAFAAARAAGHTLICCEINEAPPNPASDRFHDRLGFASVGRAALGPLNRPTKTVRYLQAELM